MNKLLSTYLILSVYQVVSVNSHVTMFNHNHDVDSKPIHHDKRRSRKLNNIIQSPSSSSLLRGHGSEVGKFGASKEVEDVEHELIHMRELEGNIEKDLANILESVTEHSITLLHMEEVLTAATNLKGYKNSDKNNDDNIKKLILTIEENPTNLTDLSLSLIAMRRDLALLVQSINASEFELNEVKEVTGQKEVVEGLLRGKVEVDYESGKIGSLSHHHNRITRLANESSRWSTTALSKQVAEATTAADPAVLHLDVQLLQDMVVLCLATGVGGLLAALVDLPHTLGYILGGMLVGPSCLDFIKRVVQAETLAQFGSIFMLFGHGLIYSQHYRAPMKESHENSEHMQNDTVTGGFLFVVTIFVVVLLLVEATGIVNSFLEGTLLALAMALSSTSVVMDTLTHCRLRETLYGSVVIEIMAVQDLFMAPLLAIPTAMTHILPSATSRGELVFTVMVYASGIALIIILARHFVPRFMKLLSNPERALSPQLFTLAVVSYCLGLSLLAEWLELSHEAGALFAGLVLMDTPHVQKAATAVEPLTSLFGGMYLASLGMIMSPTFLMNHLVLIMTYVGAIYLLKVTVVTGVMRTFGFTVSAALSAGVIMAQVSEVSLFFIARAQQLGLVSRHIYLLMLATTVTLLAVAPLATNVVKRVDKREYSALDMKYQGSKCASSYFGLNKLNNILFTQQKEGPSNSNSSSSLSSSSHSSTRPTSGVSSMMNSSTSASNLSGKNI